jgi:hypothetical protein
MSTTEINTGDGVMVEISTTPRTTQATSLGGTMFRKEDRAKLSMEKRTELFDKIVLKKLDTKFTEVSISLTDVEKLDDTYNIAMLVDRVRDHFIKYDLHGVFNIVDVSDPETDPTVNKALGSLFAAYSTISEDEVALSNEWYRRWAVSGEYETNLRLSMDFLEQNTSDSLWEKCLETHNLYPSVQHGGPLLFVIMMKKLQYDTEDAVRYLQESVKKMKLTHFDGENVERAVSLLRGAERRFKNTKMGVPDDFTQWVLDIFQTSSVAAFNSQFALYNGMFSLGRKVATAPFITPTPNELYRLAEQTYLELSSTGAWTGVSTKGTKDPAGLTAGGHSAPKSPPTCWNCGEVGHTFPTCPKPKNETRIAENKAKVRKDRKQGGSAKAKNGNKKQGDAKVKNSKWAPPTSTENNKRIIDGTPHFWSPRNKRWFINKRAIEASQAAQVIQPPPASAPPAAPGPSGLTLQQLPPVDTGPDRAATRRVAFSNTAHVISEALRNLSQSFE